MTLFLAALLGPWLAAVVLGVVAGPVGRRLPPAAAVRLLSVAGLVTALATGFVLAVVAFTLAAQNQWLADVGGWSPAKIRLWDPVPPPVGIVAGVAVVWLFAAAVTRAVRTGRGLWVAGMTCRRLGAGIEGMVVVDEDHPEAYALPGLSGRIVVSTGMLRALDPAERRVLLAHEASHLAHHHHLYRLLADLAAAANPLLRPVAAAVHRATERWADEDAAARVNDRQLAARAIARAGLAVLASSGGSRRPAVALAAAHGPVVERARALLAPAPRPRRLLAAALTALILATTTSVIIVDHTTEKHFEQAHTAATR